MNRRSLVGVLVSFVLCSCVGIQSVQLFGADANETTRDVVKQQMVLAENALRRITDLEARGQVGAGMDDVSRWSRRLVEATRRSGASKAEVNEALKQHQSRMDARLERIKKLYDAAVVPEGDVWEAEYEALEAKNLLRDSLVN